MKEWADEELESLGIAIREYQEVRECESTNSFERERLTHYAFRKVVQEVKALLGV